LQIRDLLDLTNPPTLEEEEYPAPTDDIGRGDLSYKSGTTYYVVELKWIDYEGARPGNPTRNSVITRNTQRRSGVKEQTRRYKRYWETVFPGNLIHCYAIINDENGRPIVHFHD
jgi:hypothetical protein